MSATRIILMIRSGRAAEAEGDIMSKHMKTRTPSDADLKGNPLIGGAKGAGMAQATPDDLEASQGGNTIEGDVLNDVNSHGGIDKAARDNRRKPNR